MDSMTVTRHLCQCMHGQYINHVFVLHTAVSFDMPNSYILYILYIAIALRIAAKHYDASSATAADPKSLRYAVK